MPDIIEVSRAIKKTANEIGYDFFPGQGGPRTDIKDNICEYVLNGAFQFQKGDNRPLLQVVVVIKSDHFRITFETIAPTKANDLDQLCTVIKEWLLK
jgi:hypothetical protein